MPQVFGGTGRGFSHPGLTLPLTGVAAAGAVGAIVSSGGTGGSAPQAVVNQRIVNQGGNTNDLSHAGGNVTTGQSIYWEPPAGGLTPDSYIVQINTVPAGSATASGWSDLTTVSHTGAARYVYTDNVTSNIYNATNIQEDFGSSSPTPIGPCQAAAYRVLASTSGVRGPVNALVKMMFYEGTTPAAWSSTTTYLIGDRVSQSGNNYYLRAASSLNQTPASNTSNNIWWLLAGGNNCNGPSYQLSFGLSSYTDSNPRTGGTNILAVSSGQGGVQLALDAPITWIYGGAMGAFALPLNDGFFTVDVTPSKTGQTLSVAFHARSANGDVEPHANLNLLNYGPACVAGVTGTYKVPLKDLAFGTGTGTMVIVSGTGTLSGYTGPGVDAAAQISGTNITQGTWVDTNPSQNGNGSYPILGQTNAASGTVVIQGISGYKYQIGLSNAASGDSVQLDNIGITTA